MDDFLLKSVGSRKGEGILALDDAHAHKIEVATKERGWYILDDVSEVINQLRVSSTIIIPVYRMEDVDSVYSVVLGFASGQVSLSLDSKNISVTPKYETSALVLLVTHDFIHESKHPWLQTLGMVYQAD